MTTTPFPHSWDHKSWALRHLERIQAILETCSAVDAYESYKLGSAKFLTEAALSEVLKIEDKND